MRKLRIHMRMIRTGSLWLILMLVSPFLASAHGMGQELAASSGEYQIEVVVSEKDIYIDEPVRFSFELHKDDKEVAFSDVWVRIANQDKVLFNGNIHRPESGLVAGMGYQFLEAGGYELTVRYLNDDQQLAETSFPLTVKKEMMPSLVTREKETTQSNNWIWFGLAGFALGGAITWFIKK